MAARKRESDLDYLRAIEELALAVVEEAAAENWLVFGDEGERTTIPLHRAINQLATRIRVPHYDGDGCVEHLEDLETN